MRTLSRPTSPPSVEVHGEASRRTYQLQGKVAADDPRRVVVGDEGRSRQDGITEDEAHLQGYAREVPRRAAMPARTGPAGGGGRAVNAGAVNARAINVRTAIVRGVTAREVTAAGIGAGSIDDILARTRTFKGFATATWATNRPHEARSP